MVGCHRMSMKDSIIRNLKVCRVLGSYQFVVGRKAWLFTKSERGARSSCILYSFS